MDKSSSALTNNFTTKKTVKLCVTVALAEFIIVFLVLIMLSGRMSRLLAAMKK